MKILSIFRRSIIFFFYFQKHEIVLNSHFLALSSISVSCLDSIYGELEECHIFSFSVRNMVRVRVFNGTDESRDYSFDSIRMNPLMNKLSEEITLPSFSFFSVE